VLDWGRSSTSSDGCDRVGRDEEGDARSFIAGTGTRRTPGEKCGSAALPCDVTVASTGGPGSHALKRIVSAQKTVCVAHDMPRV
jgi:hypothetical protein